MRRAAACRGGAGGLPPVLGRSEGNADFESPIKLDPKAARTSNAPDYGHRNARPAATRGGSAHEVSRVSFQENSRSASDLLRPLINVVPRHEARRLIRP